MSISHNEIRIVEDAKYLARQLCTSTDLDLVYEVYIGVARIIAIVLCSKDNNDTDVVYNAVINYFGTSIEQTITQKGVLAEIHKYIVEKKTMKDLLQFDLEGMDFDNKSALFDQIVGMYGYLDINK